MKLPPIFSLLAVLPFTQALASPAPQPDIRYRCEFETRNQGVWLGCKARVELCDLGSPEARSECRGRVKVECSNRFELHDRRHVKVRQNASDDLLITARDGKDKVLIEVENISGAPGTREVEFDASLRIFSEHAQWDRRRLKGSCELESAAPIPEGSCQPANSLSVLVQGSNVVSYVPKGSWSTGTTGIAVANVEGSAVTNTVIPTAAVVNSCASNPVTGQTVCTANTTDIYLLSGTSLSTTLTSGGSGFIGFSGGVCTNCNVAMDAVHNRAIIGLAIENKAGFQVLNLSGTPALEPAFLSGNTSISENPLIDPIRNLLVSPSEDSNFELIDIATTTSPVKFENPVTPAQVLDSAGEDCATGIALSPAEFSFPSRIFVTDLTQAAFTPGAGGAPGSWSAPSQIQELSESFLNEGASGMAIAQGTHIGVVTGEFGGNALTAFTLPAASGSGVPAIQDWVTCNIDGFSMGFDPHTLTSYQSPANGNAIALFSNENASQLAVVDLTLMLDPAIVPRTPGGHACESGTLPSGVVRFITLP